MRLLSQEGIANSFLAGAGISVATLPERSDAWLSESKHWKPRQFRRGSHLLIPEALASCGMPPRQRACQHAIGNMDAVNQVSALIGCGRFGTGARRFRLVLANRSWRALTMDGETAIVQLRSNSGRSTVHLSTQWPWQLSQGGRRKPPSLQPARLQSLYRSDRVGQTQIVRFRQNPPLKTSRGNDA